MTTSPVPSTAVAAGAAPAGAGLPPRQLYIDGSWRDSTGDQRSEVVDPATGKTVTTVAAATAADLETAVAAARRAFDSGPWPRMSGRERARVLYRAAELIKEHTEELALLETRNVGKPLHFSKMIDIGNTITHFEYYAGLAYSIDGATRQTGFPALAYTRREPLGVVGAITPFNFPLILSTTKIAPALAAGNTVVHKPAGDTPLSALRLAELLTEAGLPDGVLNVVTGSGAAVGEQLIRHPGIDKIAFTGSTDVGRHVGAVAGESLTPVTLELGGKAANIVFTDADLDKATEAVVGGFVFNTGQFCMGGHRVLVQRPVYDEMLARLAGAAGGVPVGDPMSPETIVGPLASPRQLEKVSSYVEIGLKHDGARLVAGGQPIDSRDGYFFAPTVFADVSQRARIVQEEIFGPVLTVQPFDTEEEAVALANGTPYVFASGLQTGDVARAHRVAAALRAGITWINTWGMLDVTMPFGGAAQSGHGREYGPEGLEPYLHTKSVILPLM